MTLLGLKVLLTPILIAALTLLARSRGSRVAGLAVGLPLTSGPVSVFLALENGAPFSAHAAVGALIGLVGVQAFCFGYAILARSLSWAWALLGGSAACLLAVAALQRATFSLGAALGLAVATAVLLRAAMGSLGARDGEVVTTEPVANKPPPWDLPARVVIATSLVVTLTMSARRLGPGWSGALSSLPVFTAVLAAFLHDQSGRRAARTLLQSTITGTVGSIAFFAIVGTLLAPGAVASTYLVATAAAATISGVLGSVHHL